MTDHQLPDPIRVPDLTTDGGAVPARLLFDPHPGLLPPARLRSGATIISGYVYRYQDDQRPTLVYPEVAAGYEVVTTGGPVRVMPLHLMPTGAAVPRSVPAADVPARYAELGEVGGWVHVWSDDQGIGISGVITANEQQRGAMSRTRVLADFRPRADTGALMLTALSVKVPGWAVPTRAYGLTKRQLIDLLTTGVFADMPDDAPMVVGPLGGREGDDCAPLVHVAECMYWAKTTARGMVGPTDDEITGLDGYYTDADAAKSGAVRCLILDSRA